MAGLNLSSEALRSFQVGASEALQRIVAAGQTARPERADLTAVSADAGAALFDFDGTLTATPGERACRRGKVAELRDRAPMLEPRLRRLRDAGLLLGIISKSSEATVVTALSEVGFRNLFEGPILTKAVGLEGKAGFINELCEEGGALAHLGREGARRVLLVDDDVFELERARDQGIQTYAAPETGGLQVSDFEALFVHLGLERATILKEELSADGSPAAPTRFPIDEEVCRLWSLGLTAQSRGLGTGQTQHELGKGSGPLFGDLYVLDDAPLGFGSFGCVASGTHLATGERCAVKAVTRKTSGQEYYATFVEQDGFHFLLQMNREAPHRNVVRYFDFLVAEEVLYTCMEPLAGAELVAVLQESGPVTEVVGRRLAAQALSALSHVHDVLGVGLIHRDVKLENLRFRLPGAESELVLLDFGLSCPAMPECERQVVGTLLYTAPEVFSKWYSTRVDIWSLGVVLYIVLAGRPPWYQDRRGFRNRKVIGEEDLAQALGTFRAAGLPAGAASLVESLLVLDPGSRSTAAVALEHPWITAQA